MDKTQRKAGETVQEKEVTCTGCSYDQEKVLVEAGVEAFGHPLTTFSPSSQASVIIGLHHSLNHCNEPYGPLQ
jgi:hypothetical protein